MTKEAVWRGNDSFLCYDKTNIKVFQSLLH